VCRRGRKEQRRRLGGRERCDHRESVRAQKHSFFLCGFLHLEGTTAFWLAAPPSRPPPLPLPLAVASRLTLCKNLVAPLCFVGTFTDRLWGPPWIVVFTRKAGEDDTALTKRPIPAAASPARSLSCTVTPAPPCFPALRALPVPPPGPCHPPLCFGFPCVLFPQHPQHPQATCILHPA
jgi:hypothetical protein